MTPSHPILRYHGGKWRLAPWVIRHFPAHKVYVEPFGGAASVLLRKPRSTVEVYNDLHGRVVNLFRVLRDRDQARRLAELLRLTPYAAAEYRACYEVSADPVEDARRLIVLGAQGHGSTAPCGGSTTGWRRGVRQNNTYPATAQWVNVNLDVLAAADRFRGVFIEQSDALDVMRQWDDTEVLFYVDPPYVQSTRGQSTRKRAYLHELDDDAQTQLLSTLVSLKGRVVLSGYNSPLYAETLGGWHSVEKRAIADQGAARVETLWMNFRPQSVLL